jgi:hypothetical protein
MVDMVHVDPVVTTRSWRVDATVNLVDGFPAIVDVRIQSDGGLDHEVLQGTFRWATPLDVVTQAMPALLAIGIDPFNYDLPLDGFPMAAYVDRTTPTRLTDAFLEGVAARYLVLGRGYAKEIAHERNVSPRTVVSWIEKARARGILTPTTPGSLGGKLVIPRQNGVG